MAVTNQKSVQLQNREKNPPAPNKGYEIGGKIRWAKFSFTQSGLGDAGSTVDLAKIPAGSGVIIKTLSRLKWSAFGGTGTVLDVGHTGYTKTDGTAVPAASNVIEDSRSVVSAGQSFLGVGTNAEGNEFIEYDAKGEITIQATVRVNGIPDGATLDGWIAYATTA